MQITNINNQMNFTGRSSITRMLKLSDDGLAVEEANKLADSFIKVVYENKDELPPIEYAKNNKTLLAKTKYNMGDRLLISKKVESEVKDENIQIPGKDVVNLLDILSENMKKPISKLIPKFDKIPSISKILDNTNLLFFLIPEIPTSVLEKMGNPKFEREASLVPLRKVLEGVNVSAAEMIEPAKTRAIGNFRGRYYSDNYKNLREEVKTLITMSQNKEDKTEIAKQIQRVRDLFVKVAE